MIVTHFDNDHCGGAVDLLKGLSIKNLYVNDLNHPSYAAKSIYKEANEVGTNLVLAHNNQIVYNKDGLILTNLLGESTDSDNENSIITLLEYKDFTMLFTGDAGVKGLTPILNEIPREITVLKVPHHGANGGLNKEIINYLSPQYSIISVGENKFGHPAMYILELLKDSRIYRTDIDNSILIKFGKCGLHILTYDLKKKKYTVF